MVLLGRGQGESNDPGSGRGLQVALLEIDGFATRVAFVRLVEFVRKDLLGRAALRALAFKGF
jgi:hypothetical protein